MVPAMMEELLFDDILFGEVGRKEHGLFRRVLQLLGIEVLDARELLVTALEQEEARRWLVGVLEDELPPALRDAMAEASGGLLARRFVEGVRFEPGHEGGVHVDQLFELPPVPNWCFQRDPQIVCRGGVIFSSMATPARFREALLTRTIFQFHPKLADTPVLFDPLRNEEERPLFLGLHRPRLEGGDVLVLSKDLLAVGLSERTNEVGIRRLARGLARREDGPRYLLVVRLPAKRAYMHLDTLFTQVDRDACLVHAPVIDPKGCEAASVYELDLRAPRPTPVERGDLISALARHGIELEPIPCGGNDPIAQQREQWTDGANCFALAPGVITLYDRNLKTAEELDRRGFRVLAAEDLLLGREELDLDSAERVCILLPSHEISRARGGPHCLTHPLVRE